MHTLISQLDEASTHEHLGFDTDSTVERLVAAAQNGDMEAFGALVLKYQSRIFRVVYTIVQNREDAEDVTQTAFLKAMLHLGDFRGHAKFSTWLTRIAINHSLMELRRSRTKGLEISIDWPIGPDEDQPALQLPDPTPNPEERCRHHEAGDHLADALQKLRPALRIVFVLRDVEGLSIEETAEALELSVQAVKTRLLRARLALRQLLQEKLITAPDGHSLELRGFSAIL